jgi:hypothetical protein
MEKISTLERKAISGKNVIDLSFLKNIHFFPLDLWEKGGEEQTDHHSDDVV